MSTTYKPNGAFEPNRGAELSAPEFARSHDWAAFFLADMEEFDGTIWNPACRNGDMSRILESAGCRVISSDLCDRGYGKPGVDFLRAKGQVDNIVAHPPDNCEEQFVQTGLRLARRKCAFLLRMFDLDEASGNLRVDALPVRVWVFSERITFFRSGAKTTGESGTTGYAWLVWDKDAKQTGPEIWEVPLGY